MVGLINLSCTLHIVHNETVHYDLHHYRCDYETHHPTSQIHQTIITAWWLDVVIMLFITPTNNFTLHQPS